MTDARGHRVTIGIEVDWRLCSRRSARRSSFPAICGLTSKARTIRRPIWPIARRCCRRFRWARRLRCALLEPKSHTTQPPNRYSEASLTRALEEMGIGRPSTYASIIDTILAREYVFKLKRGNVLVPTWTAFAVSQLLEAHLPELVDYQFTAEMEDELDAISRGEMNHLDYLRTFYFGNEHPGSEAVAGKTSRRDRRPRRVPHLAGQAAGKRANGEPRFSSASAATDRSWSRATGGRACPTSCRPMKLTLGNGPGNARQGRPRATSRWGFAPIRTSRCS